MSNIENEPEVKIVERVEIAPAGGDNVDEPENETQPESSQEETNDEEGTQKEPESEETEVEAEAEAEAEPEESEPVAPDADDDAGEIKHLPGETPREYAQRLEITRLKGKLRGERTAEILTPPPAQAKKELSPERKKVLEKYKQEDLNTLKEVFDVMAEDMGFVRRDQLDASTTQQKNSEVLDAFLEKHPEYQPQNDKDNLLWGRFTEEYSMYKPPSNPKDLKKVLEKVHREVFGIKPATALNTNAAAKEKVKVASHSSSSRPNPSREGIKRAASPTQGLRTDMLKGFSDDELAELSS